MILVSYFLGGDLVFPFRSLSNPVALPAFWKEDLQFFWKGDHLETVAKSFTLKWRLRGHPLSSLGGVDWSTCRNIQSKKLHYILTTNLEWKDVVFYNGFLVGGIQYQNATRQNRTGNRPGGYANTFLFKSRIIIIFKDGWAGLGRIACFGRVVRVGRRKSVE